MKDGGGDTHDMDLYFKEISESDSRVVAATSAEAGSGKGPAVVDDADDADDVDDIVMEETARIQIASSSGGVLPFNQQALQRYILHCAQNAEVSECIGAVYACMYVCMCNSIILKSMYL